MFEQKRQHSLDKTTRTLLSQIMRSTLDNPLLKDFLLRHLKLSDQKRFISSTHTNSHTSVVKATQLPALEKMWDGNRRLTDLEVQFAVEQIGRFSAGLEGLD